MRHDRPEDALGRLRCLPTKTVEHVRSAHDVRHQTTMRHSTGEGDPYKQLQRLEREKETLERRLLIWVSQKERTEAQIAAVDRERVRILEALEPQVLGEAGPCEPVPLERRRRAF